MLSTLFAWLRKGAGSLEKIVESYFSKIKKYTAEAIPVVTQISQEIGFVADLTQDEAINKAGEFLRLHVADFQKIENFLVEHERSLVPDILKAVAAFVLQNTSSHFAQMAIRDLNAIVELAYASARASEG
jgi:hypothetical protein